MAETIAGIGRRYEGMATRMMIQSLLVALVIERLTGTGRVQVLTTPASMNRAHNGKQPDSGCWRLIERFATRCEAQ